MSHRELQEADPPACPACGRAQVLVVCGMPDEGLSADAIDGMVVLGCFTMPARWACPHHGISKKASARLSTAPAVDEDLEP